MARFNRAPNRLFRVIAGWFPGFGVVVHRGRRSGLVYRTPVKLFRREQWIVIACVYGSDSGWVTNVVAAGGCELLHLGRRTSFEGVEVVRDESRRLVPWIARPVFRFLRVAEFVLLEPATAATAGPGK
jgi:deazaflavin-dependent oxidoreductase (nitroreductase family)